MSVCVCVRVYMRACLCVCAHEGVCTCECICGCVLYTLLTHYTDIDHATVHIIQARLTTNSFTIVQTRVTKLSYNHCQSTSDIIVYCSIIINVSTATISDHSVVEEPLYGWSGETLSSTDKCKVVLNHHFLSFWISCDQWANCKRYYSIKDSTCKYYFDNTKL